MKKPNFLIVGAAKSGTTSLYHYLKAHSDVFMPEWKEPSYFCPEAGGIDDWGEYIELFNNAENQKCIGEASVSYLVSKDAPNKIREKLGQTTKIIILLRNPVFMAYSNWGQQVRTDQENESFFSAIEDEKERLNGDKLPHENVWFCDVAYIYRASYFKQVKRYLDIFGRDNVLILIYEEFFREGLPLFSSLCDFLKIDNTFRPSNKAYNVAGRTRSKILSNITNTRQWWKEPLKLVIPSSIRKKMVGTVIQLNRVDESLPELQDEEIYKLQSMFRDDVEKLSELINRKDLIEAWNFNGR